MMIIQDEHILKAESTMIGEQNSIIKEDEINDLSITKTTDEKRHEDLFKSPNKRKQIKPNRVMNDDEGVPTDLTNGQSPSPENNNSDPNSPTKAYCNLCERSFCNKYFLKTHFAKKHGVLNIVSPTPSSTDLNTNQSISPSSSSPIQSTEPSSQKMGEDYCEICQKRFCNKYYLRKHKGECHGIYTDYIKSLQKSANESPVKNQPSRPTQVPSNMLLLNPFYLPTTTTDVKSLFAGNNDNNNNNGSVSSSPPPSSLNLLSQRTVRRCHVCQQEFRNKALLRMHMNTFHPNETTTKKNLTSKPLSPATTTIPATFPISPSNTLGFLQPYVDTTSPLAHKLVAGQAPPSSYGILHDSYFCAKMADRVVCEICNKQVCNKYFLKTHKAKVHGITNGTNHTSNGNGDNTLPTMVPPSTPHRSALTDVMKSPGIENQHDEQTDHENDNPSSEPIDRNESNNENTETYCYICKKDFSTKYLYLFHMQTLHNETSDSTYQTLIQFMKAATGMHENSIANPFLSLGTHSEQQEHESEDESDGNLNPLKRKRSLSQSSTDTNKRMNSLNEANGGLQPFLLESEDPKFAHTFVPCMVYLPVIRRVTKQVKINLRLKPVLTDNSSSSS
ncbi:hypothetical protein I4U23_014141 [Adineta vaga]|nr:hypothetical protein I4U23_014141 [Adineta vaga]